MKTFLLVSLAILNAMASVAQFAPQAGIAGSTAIPATSADFTAWATHCSIHRGLQQTGNNAGGYTSSGDSLSALGSPDGNVVSLGDSGVAVLTFSQPIVNGNGPDFAIFENGFKNPLNGEEAFLELAFVEVSSDGSHYVRFPATSLTPDTFQVSSIGGISYCNARLLNNLAGKYVANYGTPFDLSDLADSANLDINHITSVRIVDVIGDVGAHASYDAYGHKINDPYPTPFPTGGFDLDAVGIIHQSSAGIGSTAKYDLQLYPNPSNDLVQIVLPCDAASFLVSDFSGQVLLEGSLDIGASSISLKSLATGCYILHLTDKKGGQSWTGKLYRL